MRLLAKALLTIAVCEDSGLDVHVPNIFCAPNSVMKQHGYIRALLTHLHCDKK